MVSPGCLPVSASSSLGSIPEWPPCRYAIGSGVSSSRLSSESYSWKVSVTTVFVKTFMKASQRELVNAQPQSRCGGTQQYAHSTVLDARASRGMRSSYNRPMSSARSPARAPRRASSSPLGSLAPREFMQRFWQKDALLVRNALPGFTGMLDRDDVFELAMRDDVESRLVRRDGGRWTLVHGPVTRSVLHALPARDWTLLVQGVNLHVPQADALLRQFAFVPYARLDDVMVSYAAPGGGVGAHLDAYDVFLLQGFGRRRWRYGRQQDAAF